MVQRGQTKAQSLLIGQLRENQAITLYASGMTFAEVAKEVGYADEGGAHKAVQRALKKRTAETMADCDALVAKHMEIIRLCVRGQMPAVLGGNPRAVEVVIKALEREAKMCGIDAPAKTDIKITDAFMAELEDLAEQLVSLDAQEALALAAQQRG